MNDHKVSYRELLIRMDERQRITFEKLEHYMTKVDDLEDEVQDLDRKKISKQSISWILTVLGGVIGFVSFVASAGKDIPKNW